jgi:predicted dehydrogenase
MIKIGVIGCGNRMKKILKILLSKKSDIVIESLYDVSSSQVKNFKKEFGEDIFSAETYQEVVDNKEIKWIFIGSPNFVHKEQILYSINKDKNIFLEKPVAVSFEELKEIKDSFFKKNLSFLVSYPLRYSPHYRKIRKILDSGKIGNIVSFEFNETLTFNHGACIMADWRRFEKFSGGHLLEKCCHDFDVANLLLKSIPSKVASFGGLNIFLKENKRLEKKIKMDKGEFKNKNKLSPFALEKDVVDNQVVILEYRNGSRAVFHTNTASTMPERRMYMCGTKGSIKTDVLKGFLQYKILGSSETAMIIDEKFKGGHGAGDFYLINELVDAMEGESYSSLDDGIKSAVIAIAAERARKESCVVDLEPIWKEFGY